MATSVMARRGRRGWHSWTLAGLEGLTGAAAVYGGIGMIRDGFGMPDGWLAGTPPGRSPGAESP